MSKTKKIIVSIIVVLLAVIIAAGAYIMLGVVGLEEKRSYGESAAVNENVNTNVTVIDDNVSYQNINGFGASACWWSQDVGAWENSKEILSYLYDKNKGIGLNIYRYNIGAGSKGDEHILTENRSTECFLKPDGSYDFTADAAAQKCLAQARELAGDDLRVTLFANSPPVSMTKNGLGYGSALKEDEPWVTNLDAANYQSFADYCYNVAEHFVNEGYKVTDVSPINEPQYSWAAWYNEDGTFSVNQEGCHYSKTEARDLYKVMIDKFSGSELEKNSDVKVSMFESGSMEGKGSSCAAYMDCILGKGPKYVFENKALRDYFKDVSMHSYWSSTETKKDAAAYLADKYSNYNITATEYCQMTNDENTGVFDLISKEENGTNGMGIEYGVAMAKVIVDDLTILNANEWNWWLGCSYGVYPDGLVYINADDHNDIRISKRLWCLGNFSKFIREGAVRIACSSGVEGVDCCAFYNTDDTVTVVYVNNTDNDAVTRLAAERDYSVYTTSDKYDLEKTADGVAGDADIEIPAMSVVTVKF